MDPILKQLGLKEKSLPIVGGDINQAYRVTDGKTDYFLKYHPHVDAAFFQAEVFGLEQLGQIVRVPKVFQVGDFEGNAFLLLEWIEPGNGDQRDLAKDLIKIHQVKSDSFGLSEDNFIGLLPQINHPEANWWDFYFKNRLEVQIEIAKNRNHWTPERAADYAHLKAVAYKNWGDLTFKPSLLHGDFWSGNTFFDQAGQPIFVDPAVYFGHRELDIAMSQLFGGFRNEFLETYQAGYLLTTGFEERLPLYQLYYLLAHLNMFGESYGGAVDKILGGNLGG
ncbi:fructosamine kinase family protein [Enterococcus sp. AZ103]|uniref:fructosamine kinase family protein n=1 Tax=Enterococcus sp. AZ103 TaxID=2774628 RepID=UPI003F2401AE